MGRIRTFLLIVAAVVMAASVATAQSLAEVAKKEKKRRETTSSDSKTITERELTRSYGGLPATTSSASSSSSEAGEEGESGEVAADEEQEDDRGAQEQQWRARFKAARDKLRAAEEAFNATNFGEGQGVSVDMRGGNQIARREKAERDVETAREELAALQEEARRAGVPPGWTR